MRKYPRSVYVPKRKRSKSLDIFKGLENSEQNERKIIYIHTHHLKFSQTKNKKKILKASTGKREQDSDGIKFLINNTGGPNSIEQFLQSSKKR